MSLGRLPGSVRAAAGLPVHCSAASLERRGNHLLLKKNQKKNAPLNSHLARSRPCERIELCCNKYVKIIAWQLKSNLRLIDYLALADLYMIYSIRSYQKSKRLINENVHPTFKVMCISAT